MQLDLYDRFGDAIAYSDDGQHIYLFGGQAICYLVAEAMYHYRGDQMGWYEHGWIRDKNGRCVAYSQWATDGPKRAPMHTQPAKSEMRVRPPKPVCDPKTLRPIHSNAWSEVSAKNFFSTRPQR